MSKISNMSVLALPIYAQEIYNGHHYNFRSSHTSLQLQNLFPALLQVPEITTIAEIALKTLEEKVAIGAKNWQEFGKLKSHGFFPVYTENLPESCDDVGVNGLMQFVHMDAADKKQSLTFIFSREYSSSEKIQAVKVQNIPGDGVCFAVSIL